MSTAEKKVRIPKVQNGEVFTVAGMEFIKFPAVGDMTPVVMKDAAFRSAFGSCNDLTKSPILERLKKEILPRTVEAVGEENICTFKTDLTTLDGLKPYAPLESQISLPTLDFYRANAEIFDRHKLDCWWWLATPWSAEPHYSSRWILCVSPAGNISYGGYGINDTGVRPFLFFKSSIFESSED